VDIDPVLKEQIDGYVMLMEAKFNDPNLTQEEFQSLMEGIGPHLMSLGYGEADMAIFS
jgi:hypothetical protein